MLFNFLVTELLTLNALKYINHVILLFQFPQKMLCYCSYTMLTGNTCQFQMVEQAFSCKDRSCLQPRFELPSALTSYFRDYFDRYDRRQKYFNHEVRHPLLKSLSTGSGGLAWWYWQQTQGLKWVMQKWACILFREHRSKLLTCPRVGNPYNSILTLGQKPSDKVLHYLPLHW